MRYDNTFVLGGTSLQPFTILTPVCYKIAGDLDGKLRRQAVEPLRKANPFWLLCDC